MSLASGSGHSVAGKWVRTHLFCYESHVIDKYVRIGCRRLVGLDIGFLLGALEFYVHIIYAM